MPGRWASTIPRPWCATPSGTASRSGRSTSRRPAGNAAGRTGRLPPPSGRPAPPPRLAPGTPRAPRPLLAPPQPAGAIRLGLRFVRGVRARPGSAIEEEQARAPFADLADFVDRCGLQDGEIETLASIGALACFGLSRRGALWKAARLVRPAGPLLEELPETEPSPLREMTVAEETQADYGGTQLAPRPHPLSYPREQLRRRRTVP